jgi:hypothetical protein
MWRWGLRPILARPAAPRISPLAWSSALPFAKGAVEGIRVFVPEQACGLGKLQRGIEEILFLIIIAVACSIDRQRMCELHVLWK